MYIQCMHTLTFLWCKILALTSYAFNIPGFEPRGTEFYNLGTRLPEQHNQALGLPRYSIVQVENNFFYDCFLSI